MALSQSKVTDKHISLAQAEPIWEKVATVLGGTDAMKAAAITYFPQNFAHRTRPQLFCDYVSRGMHANMTGRTLESMVGAVFRKSPVVEVPSRYKPRLESINGRSDTVESFSKKLVREVLAYGRIGLLTDAPAQPDPFDPLSRLPKI